MKSHAFRSLIRKTIIGSIPILGALAGCGTCYDSQQTSVPETAMLRLRLQAQSCASYCGPLTAPTADCVAVVQGQSSFTIECGDGGAPRGVDGAISGSIWAADCGAICGDGITSCSVAHTAGMPAVNRQTCVSSHLCIMDPKTVSDGRRPAELYFAPSQAADAVGAFFAHVMQLEAASIDAFDILAAELQAHGAPASLIAAAHKARADEVRHTRMAAALLRRFGGEAAQPTVIRHPVRPLAAIALENAVEGCVREAFGAFQASWQASASADATVRAVMRSVARDEIAHAELAFAVARWAESQLPPDERAEVESARAAAIAELLTALEPSPPPELLQVAGLPPPAVSQAFVRAHAQLLGAQRV